MRSNQFARLLSAGLLEATQGTAPIHPHDLSPVPQSTRDLTRLRAPFPRPQMVYELDSHRSNRVGWPIQRLHSVE